ncbi:pyridoxamine 5'-phosphate oxidase family protein [Thiohalomonas denitrificans]|uniref:pyridoxamine 5'-phosphate oxidase family protein n=1 Tax=Thiohalomonas denitrificans TaxID=415747 RepID=UPI0026E9F1A6|nr:pyridoxamine 5'-phosphate oxidase family protein [Thiohalomonas denitrificans]
MDTDSFDTILENTWRQLRRATADESSALHRPVLATVDRNNGPDARTVVLREVRRESRQFFVNTDRRSPKGDELVERPRGVFVFFDPESAVQLRILTEIRIHVGDEITAEAWRKLPAKGRRRYLTAAASGSPAPAPGAGVPGPDEPVDDAAGYRHFATLEAVATHLDWLHYAPEGPVRAEFDWDEEGKVSARWLHP